jgi:hypothetical protein
MLCKNCSETSPNSHPAAALPAERTFLLYSGSRRTCTSACTPGNAIPACNCGNCTLEPRPKCADCGISGGVLAAVAAAACRALGARPMAAGEQCAVTGGSPLVTRMSLARGLSRQIGRCKHAFLVLDLGVLREDVVKCHNNGIERIAHFHSDASRHFATMGAVSLGSSLPSRGRRPASPGRAAMPCRKSLVRCGIELLSSRSVPARSVFAVTARRRDRLRR